MDFFGNFIASFISLFVAEKGAAVYQDRRSKSLAKNGRFPVHVKLLSGTHPKIRTTEGFGDIAKVESSGLVFDWCTVDIVEIIPGSRAMLSDEEQSVLLNQLTDSVTIRTANAKLRWCFDARFETEIRAALGEKFAARPLGWRVEA